MLRLIRVSAVAAALMALSPMTMSAPAWAQDVVLPAINVVPAARAVMRDRVVASGMIEPTDRVFVQPQIEGQAVDSVLADVGDRVEAGQVLARLSESRLVLQRSQLEASRAAAMASVAQARASVTEARASADEAGRVARRAQELGARGVGSQAAADQAEAARISAEARVAVSEQALLAAEAQIAVVDAQIADVDLNLARTSIVAPVAGQIIERSAQQGAIASGAAGAMFVIARDGLLELRADVSEEDVLRLEPGQKAVLSPVGVAGELTGTVRLVEPAIDAVTRLGRVRIALDAPEQVRVGQFARSEVLAAEREAVTVPVTAVSTGAEGAAVLLVEADGTVVSQPVSTGIRDGALIEIVSGLSEGDTVVARAGAFVRPGDRINPVLPDDTLAQSN